jgi:2-keto-4-pentenoate hydratase/2-oxohepta-3-ene-1,7-dioic acid hydratase in catechol pathway
MKLCQYDVNGKSGIGIVLDDAHLVDLAAAYAAAQAGDYKVPATMLGLIQDGEKGLAAARAAEAHARASGTGSALLVPLASVHLREPVSRPPKFFAMAINQGQGWRRALKPPVPRPLYFIKVSTAITGPFDPILIPDIGKVGCEVELAIIIGKGGKNIPVERAFDHVFGYTVHNDITAHELRKSGDWIHSRRLDGSEERLTYPGRYKNFDTFSPMGPWLVTHDAIGDPEKLAMTARLNDDVIQSGNSSDYIFKFAELIAYLSEAHTLEAGDIISSGTCPYVQPWSMAKADLVGIGGTVEAEIEGIGCLKNPIKSIKSERPGVRFSVQDEIERQSA